MKVKKNKTAMSIAVNYVFLFFIATVVMMIVIAIVSKSSLNANRFICKLSGTCGSSSDSLSGDQIINLSSCKNVPVEIVKHAELCYTYGQEGKVKGICYALYLPENCNIDSELLNNNLNMSRPKMKYKLFFSKGEKVIISYNYDKQRVEIS